MCWAALQGLYGQPCWPFCSFGVVEASPGAEGVGGGPEDPGPAGRGWGLAGDPAKSREKRLGGQLGPCF